MFNLLSVQSCLEPPKQMKGIKSQLFFCRCSRHLCIHISNLSNISHITKKPKILALEYNGKAYNVTVTQFIVLIPVDNSVGNVTWGWNEGNEKVWFHYLRGIYVLCKYLFDYTELQYKARDMAVKTVWIIAKRGKNTGIVVGIVCYQPPSQQDAEDEGWQPEDFCCLFVESLTCVGDFNHPDIYQVNTV